jgi:formamidopyrimidine-DNA glycosylase
MPELPEVETVRSQLAPRLLGRTVVEADSHPSAKFLPARSITGRRFTTDDRRGKFLLFGLDDDRELIVHLGMTGQLRIREQDRSGNSRPDDSTADDDAYLRAWWALDDGETLEFVDVRRFGRIRVVPSGDYRSLPTLHSAGPEPFDPDFDGAAFHALLTKSKRKLKTQLLSQRPIAGVGNIYADEALWIAKINPKATRISPERAELLLQAIREVLAKGIDNGGTTLRDYRDAEGRSGDNQNSLAAYGRSGLPCLRCDAPLRSAVIDARTTTWCPACQRR